MPRPPRRNEPGDLHHVYAGRADDLALYRDPLDRITYLDLLSAQVHHHEWRCLMFCLMTTHVHLLVELPAGNLPEGVWRVHGEYARRFNKRHGRRGRVFASRFGNTHITNDEHLWTAVRYIGQNPVAAGMCERPEDHPWSSHAYVHHGIGEPAWLATDRLLELLSSAGGDARRRYVELVTTRTSSDPTVTTSPDRS